ncbi:MAG TPA: hypothetical protein VK604_18920 [Bryobacteraceae bacterium]|nr:hypothetical protein [Bryobacteraceae bacterium]
MKHFNEEELVEGYYGDGQLDAHLAECPECRARFAALSEMLDAARNYPVPARSSEYGSEVWARLAPRLPRRKRWFRSWGFQWALAPALAALLLVAFVAGRFAERHSSDSATVPAGTGISEKARERVLLLSLSDHLERSQIVLAEIENATPGRDEFSSERDRAHELLGANRLLRQTATRLGDVADAALLDELERVLLDVANSPSTIEARDLERLQDRIGHEGLLFRVRITSTDSRERGQKL